MKLRLGLGLSSLKAGAHTVPLEPPTNILLSNSSVPEDLAVGMTVGRLTVVGSGSLEILSDLDNKFTLDGRDVNLEAGLDYETKTSHVFTARATNDAGFVDAEFTVTVTNVADEVSMPPLDPAQVTPVYSGNFDVIPTTKKSNGKAKTQGKATSIAAMILDIGAMVAGATYIVRYDPDFSLLSNRGKFAMVGIGLKQASNFHITGLKGDGSTGLNKAKVYGNWNGLNGATVFSGGAAANGTQAGPNWLKIAVSDDGSQYTLSSGAGADINSVAWTAEFTDADPDPLADVDDATTSGLAIFFPANDTGQFTIEVDVWLVSGLDLLLLSSIDELDPPAHLLISGDQQSGTDKVMLSGDQR